VPEAWARPEGTKETHRFEFLDVDRLCGAVRLFE